MEIDYSKIKVLVVEDNILNLKVVLKMLSRYKFQTKVAADGAEAIQAIAEEQPDLILLDLIMPNIDGFEVLRRVRAGEAGDPDVKVVILSALNSESDIIRGYELGANDFITKPIIMQRLFNVVETQVELIVTNRAE